MKIELPKDQLLEAIGAVERVAGKTMALPVLQCIVLEARKEGVVCRATNLEIGIERTLAAKIHTEGVIAIPASVLSSTIAHLRGTTPVVINATDTTATITADGSTAKIRLIPVDEFPPIPHVTEVSVMVPGAAMAACIRSVAYCASVSTIKPELGSVYVAQREGSLIAAATDSFRLAESQLPFSGETFTPVLIPARSVAEIARVLDAAGNNQVELLLSPHQMAVHSGPTYLSCRLIEGSFPEYRKIIPSTFTTQVVTVKSDLLHAFRKAGVFADKFNQITITTDPKAGQIALHTQNPDVGEVTDVVPAEVTGDALTLSFNLRYIVDAFQSLTSDSISMSFSGSGKPMVLRGVSEPHFVYLVMPMNR
jgi:DNA polymerase-3 subunit beta